MDRIRVDTNEELADVLDALGTDDAFVIVLGSIGNEYGYEIEHEQQEDGGWWFWTAPRVVEIPDLNETEEYTSEREAA